jgi:crotonobetainyl-CoA:carnitine CoA-transferase CaiB-like acyl-CoA transferase
VREASGSDAVTLREGALAGIRVLDLSRVLAGPFAGRILAEMGADVVKVEFSKDPARNLGPHLNGRSLYFSSLNSGKRGVALDLKTSAGPVALDALIGAADVLLESFKASTATALGLDRQTTTARNPSLVTVAISAFARDSGRGDEGAFDLSVQAEGGVMGVTGETGRPPVRAGVALGDLAAGMWAAMAAIAGLFGRSRDGRGRHTEVPLLDSTVPLLAYTATAALHTGMDPPRVGAGHHSICPYGAWPAADGWIVIAVVAEKFWSPLCEALELDELAGRPDLQTNAGRLLHVDEVDAAIGARTARLATEELLDQLRARAVPCAPVLGALGALVTPYVNGRGMVGRIESSEGDYRVVHSPLWDHRPLRPAPGYGEHNHEVLSELFGADSAELAELL